MQVSNNVKDEESRDIKEYLRKIDSLFKDGIFAYQEDTIVDKEAVTIEEENVAEEKQVPEEEKEREQKDSNVNIVTTLESMGASIDNLQLDGSRPVKVTEVTSEEQDNSLEIVVYTGPLQVASLTQVATDDIGAELELEKQSENHATPAEKKRKHSKDKK
ncbi:hypothetical protein PVK06_027195 [Gossypium arboreum]|uniref:Uncharacterized protein n=1 Tax=Gossypium arboreum TaxID=29729 RepID=A0ABR0P053_GOSAR|nr:hypothetical protein PVK06_027195 [Gossypium arboreum]